MCQKRVRKVITEIVDTNIYQSCRSRKSRCLARPKTRSDNESAPFVQKTLAANDSDSYDCRPRPRYGDNTKKIILADNRGVVSHTRGAETTMPRKELEGGGYCK